MARIAPRRQAQIANQKRSKFRELFPSLVAELGISDKELYSFLNEEFDIPLVNFTRGREKSREIPMQSKDEAYDIMKTADFMEKLEDRFSALEEPPAEKPEARDMAASAEAMPVDEEPAAPAAPKAAPKAAKASEPVTRGDLDPDMQDMMGTTGGAKEPEVNYTDEAVGLFKNTHGTEFDPKSSKDKGKLENMKKMLAEDGGMKGRTPNQVALEFYRRFPES